jgi:hypothetical protein
MSETFPDRAPTQDFVWNEMELARLLKSPAGPVARDLARRAILVQGAAQRNASGRPGPNVDTGRLRSSIFWAIGTDQEGLFADIGTNVEYGFYLETGLVNGARYPFLEPALQAASL